MNGMAKKAGIGLIVVVLCALAFYFLYYIKTPSYSLNIVREAVAKHDVATFEKHVDLDKVLDKGFDDLIAAELQKGEDSLANPFVAGIVNMIKPALVNGIKRDILNTVKGEAKAEKQDENIAQKFVDKAFEGKSEKFSIENVSEVSEEGDSAVIALSMRHKLAGSEIELRLDMAKLSDGTWRVVGIDNLAEFLAATEKAEKAKLAELNKPIIAQMAESIQLKDNTLSLTSRGTFYRRYYVSGYCDLENTSGKGIRSVTARVLLKDTEGALVRTFPLIDTRALSDKIGPLADKERIRTSIREKELDSLDKTDKKIISSGLNAYNAEFQPVRIEFEDGTVLALLDELPAPLKEK